MNQQDGFTKENIDKSKILLSGHAKDQFILRVGEAYSYFKYQKAREERLQKKVGVPRIKNRHEAEIWMRQLLEKSTDEQAATNGKSIDAVLKYLKTGEFTFFLRCNRWQFIIKRCDEDNSQFVVKTVIWLNDNIYGKIRK